MPCVRASGIRCVVDRQAVPSSGGCCGPLEAHPMQRHSVIVGDRFRVQSEANRCLLNFTVGAGSNRRIRAARGVRAGDSRGYHGSRFGSWVGPISSRRELDPPNQELLREVNQNRPKSASGPATGLGQYLFQVAPYHRSQRPETVSGPTTEQATDCGVGVHRTRTP